MPFNMERLQIKGDGGIIHVNKYDFQGIVLNRNLDILNIRAFDGKVIIDFVMKKTLVRGCKEFKDLGPQRSKSIKG